MYGIWDYDLVDRILGQVVTEPMIVGLLLGRPEQALVRDEILPSLTYFDRRSGAATHFFCVGYNFFEQDWRELNGLPERGWSRLRSQKEPPPQFYGRSDAKDVRDRGPGRAWTPIRGLRADMFFSDEAFVEFCRRVEDETQGRWHYSGGVDLILGAGRPEGLDLSRSWALDLAEATREGAIKDLGKWLERLFRFGDSFEGDDPVRDFNLIQTLEAGNETFRDALLSFLPGAIGDGFKKRSHFWLTNLTPATGS